MWYTKKVWRLSISFNVVTIGFSDSPCIELHINSSFKILGFIFWHTLARSLAYTSIWQQLVRAVPGDTQAEFHHGTHHQTEMNLISGSASLCHSPDVHLAPFFASLFEFQFCLWSLIKSWFCLDPFVSDSAHCAWSVQSMQTVRFSAENPSITHWAKLAFCMHWHLMHVRKNLFWVYVQPQSHLWHGCHLNKIKPCLD